MEKKGVIHELLKILLIISASLIYAFNINNFLHGADLLAGGFTGISQLIRAIFGRIFGIDISYSFIYIPLNAAAAILSFRFIGKRFTLYSGVFILLSSILTDLVPNLSLTDDILLCAVFGGLLNGCAIGICLMAGATSGGTDFISIFISERYGKDAWGYIFAGNIVVLCCSGLLFGWKGAMYSIILQFVSTMLIQTIYRHYQKQTLMIITEKPDEIYLIIKEITNHDATLFKGVGLYEGKERKMLYSVVSSDEISKILRHIYNEDPNAFVNVFKSAQVRGNFFNRPTR